MNIFTPVDNFRQLLGKKAFFYPTVGLVMLSGIAMCKFMDDVVDVYRNLAEITPHIREHIEANKTRLVNETGKNLSISFDCVNTVFEAGCPGAAMQYDKNNDAVKVFLDVPYTAYSIKEVGGLSRKLLRHQTPDGAYVHELGHDYTYQQIKKMKKLGTYDASHDAKSWEERLLREGIAEYFEIACKEGQLTDFDMVKTWHIKDTMTDEDVDTLYWFSPHVVKPIMDKYGVEYGIEKIYSNPAPTRSELENSASYLKRIMN